MHTVQNVSLGLALFILQCCILCLGVDAAQFGATLVGSQGFWSFHPVLDARSSRGYRYVKKQVNDVYAYAKNPQRSSCAIGRSSIAGGEHRFDTDSVYRIQLTPSKQYGLAFVRVYCDDQFAVPASDLGLMNHRNCVISGISLANKKDSVYIDCID